MSDVVGPTKLGDFSVHPHLRIDGPQPDQLAPETAREIDLEIRRLVNKALEEARQCLSENRDELEKLAQALLERETLSIDEIDVLLGRKAPEPEETTVSEAEQEETSAPEPEAVLQEKNDDGAGINSDTADNI